jgi:ABC-type Mn2+/Zn2+ transport system permease subunit
MWSASALALGVSMAAAAGLVGCFAVMRKMTLASDAISHVALPGIAIALALRLHPLLGGTVALVGGTVLIWALQHKTRLSTETIIGVVFSAALALGSVLTTGEELIDALLGNPGTLRAWEVALGIGVALAIVAFVIVAKDRLVVALVSADIARTAGVNVARLDLLYLIAFALTVGLGLRYLGVLLMGSLIIIPAATAKHVARGLREMLAVSVAVAVASTVVGGLLAGWAQRATGPVIIMVAAGCFFAGLAWRRGGAGG